jgi:hypothetical protein
MEEKLNTKDLTGEISEFKNYNGEGVCAKV